MPRLSIAQVMILVGVVALNLAVLFQGLRMAGDVQFGATFGPMAVAVQIGILGAYSGRNRAFWFGFAASGLLVALWFGVCILTLSSILLAPINAYEQLAFKLFYHGFLGPEARLYVQKRPLLRAAYTAFYMSLFQLFLSLFGGLVSSLIFRKRPASRLEGTA